MNEISIFAALFFLTIGVLVETAMIMDKIKAKYINPEESEK